jgi:hypothetical protein
LVAGRKAAALYENSLAMPETLARRTASEAAEGGETEPGVFLFDVVLIATNDGTGLTPSVYRIAPAFGGRVEERSLVSLGEARLGSIGLDESLSRSRAAA